MAIQYYMRGYNTQAPGAVGYVDWVVNDTPDSTATYVPTPFNPAHITNIVVNRIVQSKVDNFIKPNEGLTSPAVGNDGYWIHINAYDWLHSTPPGPPVPFPTQITGLAIVRGTVDGITPNDYSSLFWDEVNQTWKFAFQTAGDGTSVGLAQAVGMGALTTSGPLTIGSPAAQSGLIRIPSNNGDGSGNTGAIRSRNVANTTDIFLINSDGDDRVAIGSSNDPVYVQSTLRVDVAITEGLDPTSSAVSQTGFIRTPNNTIIVSARDVTNSFDIPVIETDFNDRIVIGGFAPTNNNILYNAGPGSSHVFAINNAAQARIALSTFTFEPTVSSPSVTQDVTTVGNGQSLTLQAQSSSAGSSFGGNVVIEAGSGTSFHGNVVLTTGTNVLPDVQISPISITVNNSIVTFGSTVTSPFIGQTAGIASGSQTTPLTIEAQSNSGSGAGTLGSNLVLSSGTAPSIGATGAGHVLIQTGGTTWIDVNPSTSPYATVTINGNLTVLGTTTTVDSTTVDIVGRVIHGNYSTGIVAAPASPNLANSMTGFAIHRGSATGVSGQDRDSAALIYNETTSIYTDGYWKLAVIKNDIDTASSVSGLVGTLPLMTSGVVVSPNATLEYSSSASIPTQGGLRVLNNTTAVASRSNNGLADLPMLATDTSNNVYVGSANNGHIFYNTGGVHIHDFEVNSTSEVQIGFDGSNPFVRESATTFVPASSGFLRTRNAITAVAARNAANTQDLLLLGTDSSNHVIHGASASPQNAGHIFNTTTGSVYDFWVNSVSQLQIAANAITFTSTDTSPTLSQANVTTASATGQSLTVQAQNATGTTSVGGALNLTSGTGTTSSGLVNINIGATLTGIFNSADPDADGYAEWLAVGSSITNPRLYQVTLSGTGANAGQTLKVNAQAGQQQTGANANNNGGNLVFATGAAGTGGSGAAGLDGYMYFMTGTHVVASMLPNKFVFNQGRRRNVTSVTGTYSVLATDDLIAITTLSTAFTITLPSSPVTGDSYEFKDTTGNAGTNNVTIAGNGHNLDGASTFVLSQPYAAVTVTYTGTQWSVT